jgi:hypothetical protein
MKTRKQVMAATLSFAAFIALALLLRPGCQYTSVHVGNEVTRMAVIVLLPCLAVGIFGTVIYDLLSFAAVRLGREQVYDDVVIAMGERGEWTASRPLKFLLLYPLIVVVWCAIAVFWLAAINCPGYGPANWIPA